MRDDDETKDKIIAELLKSLDSANCDIQELKSILNRITDVGYEYLTLKLHTGHNNANDESDEGFTGHS